MISSHEKSVKKTPKNALLQRLSILQHLVEKKKHGKVCDSLGHGLITDMGDGLLPKHRSVDGTKTPGYNVSQSHCSIVQTSGQGVSPKKSRISKVLDWL